MERTEQYVAQQTAQGRFDEHDRTMVATKLILPGGFAFKDLYDVYKELMLQVRSGIGWDTQSIGPLTRLVFLDIAHLLARVWAAAASALRLAVCNATLDGEQARPVCVSGAFGGMLSLMGTVLIFVFRKVNAALLRLA